uniref:Uncharacterized protein n=1 Tax=Panagrolaimus davidi TaxID=227884 RepID=A0A914P6F5_9BILA
MANTVEFQVAMNWSIKKETFINMNEKMCTAKIETTIPDYKYYFEIEQNDGYVAIYFNDTEFMSGTTIKEMTLSIPSAGFIADMTKVADVPKDHDFEGYEDTIVFKHDDILNPEKKFFVDDILTMKFRGTVEYSKQPESLGVTLWKSKTGSQICTS